MNVCRCLIPTVFFVSVPCARISCHLVSFSAYVNISYRIVSYRTLLVLRGWAAVSPNAPAETDSATNHNKVGIKARLAGQLGQGGDPGRCWG